MSADALTEGERRILSFWDAGMSVDVIVEATGAAVGFVERTVTFYDDGLGAQRRWGRNAALGCTVYAARLAAAGLGAR